jgi:hypothetical protein
MIFEIKPSEIGDFEQAFLEVSDWPFGKSDYLFLIINSPSSEKPYLSLEGWSSSLQRIRVSPVFDKNNKCILPIGREITRSLLFATNYLFIIQDQNGNELVQFGHRWRGVPSEIADTEVSFSALHSADDRFDNEPLGNIGSTSEIESGLINSHKNPTDQLQSFTEFRNGNAGPVSLDQQQKILTKCINTKCLAESFSELSLDNEATCKWCGTIFKVRR